MLTGQQPGPPTCVHLPRGWLTSSPSLGVGCFPGLGPGAPQSFHRGSCSLKPPTQGQGRAGAWQALAGEMEERVWWGPGPMERSQGPGGKLLWPGGLWSQPPAAEGAIGEGLEALGPRVGNPLLPGGRGTPSPPTSPCPALPGFSPESVP